MTPASQFFLAMKVSIIFHALNGPFMLEGERFLCGVRGAEIGMDVHARSGDDPEL